ncbi:MAG: hypothetical protein RIS47_434 [Bacteroidota bacterium]|jgi:ADP-ribose pyrophosphatase YjhB (NUDIX family)
MIRTLNSNISVDCVVFGFDFEQLYVLLVERQYHDPVTGKEIFNDLTLMGNHIYNNEDLGEAAERILNELTGLSDIYLQQFGAFGNPLRLSKPNDQLWLAASQRDPKNMIVTVGYFSLLNNQDVTLQWKGRNVSWYPVNEVGELAFDHKVILDAALTALRRSLMDEPIGFELLPSKFTLTQLQKLYEAVFGTELDKRNFRKRIAKTKYLIPLDEKQTGVAHKPARLYMFSREVYEKTKRELWDFNI